MLPSSSIKRTNLTGRVTKTAEYPLAEGGFSANYTGNFGKTKVASWKQPLTGKVLIQSIIAAGYSHIPPAQREMEDASLLGPTTPHYWNLSEACWDETPSKRPNNCRILRTCGYRRSGQLPLQISLNSSIVDRCVILVRPEHNKSYIYLN